MRCKAVTLMGLLLLVYAIACGVSPVVAQCLATGDVDGNGQTTPADALLALRAFLGLATLDDCQHMRANVDDPSTSGITPADALCVFQRFLNLPSCLGPPRMPISGVVSKGPVAGAMITLWTMASDGSPGRQVAGAPVTEEIITDAAGEWMAMLPASEVGPFLVIAREGTYFDETTGTNEDVETDLMSLVPVGGTSAAVTPLTHALALQVQVALQAAMQAGASPDMGLLVDRIMEDAMTTFGFDPVRTMPPDPRNLATRSTEEIQYATLLGGISQLLMQANPAFSTGRLLRALARDLSDGRIDGRQAGQEIVIDGMVIPSLIANPQTTTLADVANTFGTNPPTGTGLDRDRLRNVITTNPVVMAPLPPTVVQCRVPLTIFEGDPTDLDITALDASGAALMFAWEQMPMTPVGTFSTPDAATTRWTAPLVTADTRFTIQARVTSTQQISSICQMMVTVRNTAPFTLNVSRLNDPSQRLQ